MDRDAKNIIHVSHLKKSFKHLEVLKDINVDVREGEVVVIIGPSGSGKSTFLRCLNRLEESSGGEIVIDGIDLTDKKTDINKVRERVGMVFQHFNLFNNMNVLRNLMLAPVDLKKKDRETARREAMELLGRVGLADKAGHLHMCGVANHRHRHAARRELAHVPMRPRDERTRGIDHLQAARRRLRPHTWRHAMRREKNRSPLRHILQRFHECHSPLPQLAHHRHVMDKLMQAPDRPADRKGAPSFLDRALHPRTETVRLYDGNLHPLTFNPLTL